MKKIYINPSMEVIKIATQQMLAYSGDPTNPTPGDAGSGAAREFDFEEGLF